MKTTVWHGTVAESQELVAAIGHHCACDYGWNGRKVSVCAAHTAMVAEQGFLDRLLFYRSLRGRLVAEEWRA